jgi:hypothetical protein
MVHPEWQIETLMVIWEADEGLVSRQVWERVNSRLAPVTISRASIINFLNYMLKMDVLSGIDETGKGGHRTRYSYAKNENEYKEFIAKSSLRALNNHFPMELKKAIISLKL